VQELNGFEREKVTASGAGGGGVDFKGQTLTFKPAFGKVSLDETPLGSKPIKRAAMTHLWY